MKHIKIVGFLALAFSGVALGVNSKVQSLNNDMTALDTLVKANQHALDHFKHDDKQSGTVNVIELKIEDHMQNLQTLKEQLHEDINAAKAETATNIDSTSATVEKKSCHSCNKPKKECEVREKKSCHSCKPKVERVKKECHTCNKCHRVVEPKATKCNHCHHRIAQEVDQQDVMVTEKITKTANGEDDETMIDETVEPTRKSCASCKPKCVAKPKCSNPEVMPVDEEETVVFEETAA